MISDELKKLLENDDSGIFDTPDKPIAQTSDERLVNSFLEINKFVEENGRIPNPNTDNISERRLYSRLQGMCSDPDKIEALKDYDTNNLLVPTQEPSSIDEIIANDELGLLNDDTGILTIKNVPKKIDGADYIGRQRPAKDFDKFKHKFTECHEDLNSEKRIMKPFTNEQQIEAGEFFILKGVMVYVAEVGEKAKNKNGKTDARLRLIYENGTESDILLRSLARELYRDGRRITEHIDGLMANFEKIDTEDEHSGCIYVLASLSSNPDIAGIANLYKIGFSTKLIAGRIKMPRMTRPI